MPLAHGEYIVIYDAEDRPEPGQLRQRSTPSARVLPILPRCRRGWRHNPFDNFLSRQFTVEYCALFDGLLPALDRLEPADSAWRDLQPFPCLGAEMADGLGPLQRHRGCRSRCQARAKRLSLPHVAVDDLRGSAFCRMTGLRQRTRLAICRPGSCICAIPRRYGGSLVHAASSPFRSWWRVPCYRRWCIPGSMRWPPSTSPRGAC